MYFYIFINKFIIIYIELLTKINTNFYIYIYIHLLMNRFYFKMAIPPKFYISTISADIEYEHG